MNEIRNWFKTIGWTYEMYDGILTFVLGNQEYDIVDEGSYGYAIYNAAGAHPLEQDMSVEDVIDWLEDGT